jgi:hypothetical protein
MILKQFLLEKPCSRGVIMLGATPGTPIESMFDELIEKIHVMRTKLESGTGD